MAKDLDLWLESQVNLSRFAHDGREKIREGER
jgi:hypothetical protein